jgi:hypothetical protein
MRSDFPTPGLKRRRNRDGAMRLLWLARTDLAKAGYKPKSIRLHYAEDDIALISAACLRYQAEMLEWASGRKRDPLQFDGTIAALVRCYQRDPASRYAQVKFNTRRTYDEVLDKIERAIGGRVLANLKHADFQRWYDEAKKPKAPGEPERVRKAHGIISLLRRMVAYGVTAELPECARLEAILKNMRFKQPVRRRVKLELTHVEAFIEAALPAGRLSLALGTALQFETILRQKDAIGEWAPTVAGAGGGIMIGGKRWANGLTWADVSDDLVIRKETTKTGAIVAHDLKLCPMVMDLLALIPANARIGPLIIDERAGRPYAPHGYAREWRVIANAAGIPKVVWNMDARAGGISEADDAGAPVDHIRSAAGHSNASTTGRYIRGTIGKSSEVAKLRVALRTKGEQK